MTRPKWLEGAPAGGRERKRKGGRKREREKEEYRARSTQRTGSY